MKTSTIIPATKEKKNTARLKKLGRALLALAFWLAIWHLASRQIGQVLLLPAPLVVGQRFFALIFSGNFWHITGVSLFRILEGFLLGVASGVVLAILTHISRLADTLLTPVVKVIRATPVASFIILIGLWLHKSFVPAFIASLMVLPIVWGNVRTGIANTDGKLLEMAKVFRLGGWKTLRRIYVPSIMPHFLAACTTSLGLAWKSGIAAEVISLPDLAIGKELYNGKIYLLTPDVFVWTIVVIILSLLIEGVFIRLIKRFGRRYNV